MNSSVDIEHQYRRMCGAIVGLDPDRGRIQDEFQAGLCVLDLEDELAHGDEHRADEEPSDESARRTG